MHCCKHHIPSRSKPGRWPYRQGKNLAASIEMRFMDSAYIIAAGKAQHPGTTQSIGTVCKLLKRRQGLQRTPAWIGAGSTLSLHAGQTIYSKKCGQHIKENDYPPLLSTGETISGLEPPVLGLPHSQWMTGAGGGPATQHFYNFTICSFGQALTVTEIQH